VKGWEKHILPETFDEILEFHEAKRRLSYEHIVAGTVIA